MFARRLSLVAAATVAVLAANAAPAQAHFCFFNDPNANGDAGRRGSSGFVEFQVIAFHFTGLCDAGIAILAEAGGVEVDTLINGHGVMAGPTGGNNAIGQLNFAGIEAALGTEEDPGPAVLACL